MTALLLIDIQEGLDDHPYYGGQRNNPNAEDKAAALLAHFRKKGLPVYHVQHSSNNPDSPLHPSKPGFAIKSLVRPEEGEPHYVKHENSAFVGTSLESDLKKAGINKLVICGLTTEHCVSTSTRMAANLGFTVSLAADATAAFAKKNGTTNYPAQMVHDIVLACLRDEFATVLETDKILATL
ncbi:cysteine hydrolase family protein [Aureitalea marina]|uniref:Isochorismatase-like domain-containing protein n=1 Tax=Aureitalea marina TaxID=930804 RepID=A0A2S7KS03_9FLAO|nr:cysteine hydrolase family protein [Aureitalea marina]PQB05396.1 hypothetical protein BST85_11225 [Aureitalea marina]